MENEYSVFRFFKGETENPFGQSEQPVAYNFWDYEQQFEERFKISDESPLSKEETVKGWLYELLMNHLPDKYETSVEYFKNLYWSTPPETDP